MTPPFANERRLRASMNRVRTAIVLLGAMKFLAPDTSPDIVVSVDRTTRNRSNLAMGPSSTGDDADQGQKPRAVFRDIPAFGKPNADAGAVGFDLPRMLDGKIAANGEDPANSTWFDTKGNSRVHFDVGQRVSISRINVHPRLRADDDPTFNL